MTSPETRKLWFAFDAGAMQAVRAHDGEGLVLTRRVCENEGGGNVSFVDLTVVPPGCTIGLHMHATDNIEIYVLIKGVGEMRLDGKRFQVGPGHVVLNRPGGTHGLTNTGVDPIELVVLEVKVR